jgi:hypothetical protein
MDLIQVTRGGGKEKFVWGRSQQQEFDDLKQCLCSAPIVSLLIPTNPFDIETNALDYVWVSFSLSTTTPWPIIVRHYHMLL